MDLFDFAARDGATYGRAVKHAGQSHVIHVTRRSSDFVPAFLARHGSSNDVTDGHKLFAGDILYEMTGVSNLYLEFGKTTTRGIHALLALPGIRHRGICNRRAGKLP